jgi:allantoin racemase
MKIWFQKHVVAGRLPGLDRALEAHARRLVNPGTTVDFHSLPAETYASPLPERFVRFGAVESLFATYFSLQAVRAQRQGYDAFVIGTAQDPGLVEARAWAAIPVLGFGETAMHVASILGQRFAFVGFIPELAEPLAANARRCGFAERMAPFRAVRGGPEIVERAFGGEASPFVDAFRDSARAAIGDGADVIIPGDGLTNEILATFEFRAIDGVPVIDANGLLFTMAEQFAELFRSGVIGKPATGYYNRRPDDVILDHLLRLFAPRAFPLED